VSLILAQHERYRNILTCKSFWLSQSNKKIVTFRFINLKHKIRFFKIRHIIQRKLLLVEDL